MTLPNFNSEETPIRAHYLAPDNGPPGISYIVRVNGMSQGPVRLPRDINPMKRPPRSHSSDLLQRTD
jgi:hypothetical protein